MDNLTPAQRNVLQTWAQERDAILREIGIHGSELNELKTEVTAKGLALADLHKSISEAQGRLTEITALEERMKNSVNIEVSELTARKSRLEAECAAKEEELKLLGTRQSDSMKAIETLCAAHDKMSDQATIVDQVVGQVIERSTGALSEIKTRMDEIHGVATQVIDKSNENISQANIVIDKMPKMIFDMQRPIPVRRTYPAGHPKNVQGLETS